MAQPITNLSTGDKIKYGKYSVEGESPQDLVWQIADKNNSAYPNGSITLLTNEIIDMRAFDAKEPSNSDSDRSDYGNNRYALSNIRQWLNKSSQSWYTSQHSSDESPTNSRTNDYGTGYEDKPGFLSDFSDDEKNAILDTQLTVAKADVDGGGSEKVTDKVFLISKEEAGFGSENGITEGYQFPIFTNDSSRQASVSQQAETHSNYDKSGNWYWWLRAPYASSSYHVRGVYSDGSLSNYYAYSGYFGVRPALNLQSEVLVSDEPDSDGAHVVEWNAAPTISGQDETLGEVWQAFERTYTVNDTDSTDALTITEKIDSTTVRTISDAVRDQTYTIDLSSKWPELSLGDHTMTIQVDDGKASSTRTYNFTKVDDRIDVSGTPIQTSIAAKEVVISGMFDLAPGTELTLFVCNNALDENPTWEDATEAFNNQEAHQFTNDNKTAANWGVNYRLELLKNNATEKSYVKAIGVNFGMTGG